MTAPRPPARPPVLPDPTDVSCPGGAKCRGKHCRGDHPSMPAHRRRRWGDAAEMVASTTEARTQTR